MALPVGACLPAGSCGSGPAGHSWSEDGTRLDSRRRRIPPRRGARGALPEPGTAGQRRTSEHPARCRRRDVRGAGLPVAVVAAALATRRCPRLSVAGRVLNLRDRRGAPRVDLSGRAPQPSAGAAGGCAVDPVRPGLRRLQSNDRPPVGGPGGRPARARGHRMGHVRPGQTSTPLHVARACPARRGGTAVARRRCADGRTHPDRTRDARRARTPDLAHGLARGCAGGPTRSAARGPGNR
jgi:hypothetical protein